MGIINWIYTHMQLLATFITTTGIIVGVVYKVGKNIIKTLNKSLDEKLNEKLKGLYDNDRAQYRLLICDFAGDLRLGIKKTRYEFQAIEEIYEKYTDLVRDLNAKNHYIDGEWEFIQEKKTLLLKKGELVNEGI